MTSGSRFDGQLFENQGAERKIGKDESIPGMVVRITG